MVRESPLHLGHLCNMVPVTEMGAIVSPRTGLLCETRHAGRRHQSVARALDLDISVSERIAGPSRPVSLSASASSLWRGWCSLSLLSTRSGSGLSFPFCPSCRHSLVAYDDIAFILVTYSVAAAIVAPVWGKLSDRFGRRYILGICLLGGALSHFLLAIADTLWMVYTSRAVAGVMAGSVSVATALIADASAPDQRSGMGLIGRAFGRFDIGPGIGGYWPRVRLILRPAWSRGAIRAAAALAFVCYLRSSGRHDGEPKR